jgi:hypothetical protein
MRPLDHISALNSISCVMIIFINIKPVELHPFKVKTLAQLLLGADLPCSKRRISILLVCYLKNHKLQDTD